ncbi:helix-turn-helix domain-containing protein [Roseovarius sp.]|uniref:helix-turn-helix domain-containing protein n=1 Tax=Roseovarius sp. TaxID=1486281 RepID=UPI003BA8CFA6
MDRPDASDANTQIGACIKAGRTAEKLTLSALAEKCGLTESFLSKLERGVASASIANLLQICAALNIEIGSLFDGLGVAPARTRVSVHRRSDNFAFIPSTGYSWKRVGGGSPKDEMEVFHLVLPETDRMEAYVSHPGQEHCFVISGEVLFEVGEESFHLSTGDSIFIDSQQPHRARSAGGADAQILMTVAAADVSRVEFDWWRPSSAALQERPQSSSNGRTS